MYLLAAKFCFSGADSRSRSSTVTKAKPSAPSQIVDLHVDAQLDSIEIAVMDQSSVVTNLKVRPSCFKKNRTFMKIFNAVFVVFVAPKNRRFVTPEKCFQCIAENFFA